MEDKANKIQRSSNFIKGFMALVVIVQVVELYDSNSMDWGAIAGTFCVLSIFRGVLLSPSLLVTPIKCWFKPRSNFSKQSHKYFGLAFILLLVSAQ
jgi:hypothetical protein